MAIKQNEQEIQKCDEQLDGLYVHFGKLVSDSVQDGNLSYLFNPEFQDLERKAEELLSAVHPVTEIVPVEPVAIPQEEKPTQKDTKPPMKEPPKKEKVVKETKFVKKEEPLKHSKIEKKPEPPKGKSIERKEDRALTIIHAPVERRLQIRTRLLAEKKENVAVSSPVENIEKKEPAALPANSEIIEPINKRGLLEPYTRLNVAIYAMKQDLSLLYNDLDWLAALVKSSLHFIDHAQSHEDIKEFKELKEAINLSLGQLTEVIKQIMDTKKTAIDNIKEKSDLATSSIEKDFLDDAQAKIKDIAGSIDSLVNHARQLFEDVKHSYEKDIDRQNALLERNTALAEKIIDRETPTKKEEPQEVVTEIKKEVVLEAEEKPVEELPEENIPMPPALESLSAPIIHEEEQVHEFDPRLLEAAERKFKDELTKQDEKLAILNMLINNIPDTISDFISNYFFKADLSAKKSFLNLLAKVDNPILIEIYERFLDEEDSMLRLNGLMGLSQLNHPKAKAIILSAANDPDSSIRRLVANCVSHAGSDAEMSTIVKLINDADEGVSRIAIRKLGKSRSRFAFIHLIPKLDSEDMKIRKEAIDALKSITDTDLGYKYMAPEDVRNEAIKRWKQMWKENQTNPRFLMDIRNTKLVIKEKYMGKPAVGKKSVAPVQVFKKSSSARYGK
ncbi:MAG: HEAT repeat domain-containing protein [Candidatus Omnitrophica bacterium]|nr:HEAT repeat domain-containing protein [Candidatus Omnitrophota bacterium]